MDSLQLAPGVFYDKGRSFRLTAAEPQNWMDSMDQNEAAIPRPQPSKNRPSCARMLHLYSTAGNTPKPAIVIEDMGNEVCIAPFNHSSLHVEVFDHLSVAQREVLASEGRLWAEWPPFVPAAGSMAADVKSFDILGKMQNVVNEHENLIQSLKRSQTGFKSGLASTDAQVESHGGLLTETTEILKRQQTLLEDQQAVIITCQKKIEVLEAAVAELAKQSGGPAVLQPITEAPKGNFPADGG